MLKSATDSNLRVVGVALEGRDGSPVIVLESSGTGRFLPVSVSPFDAEMLIRMFLEDDSPDGLSPVSATEWLADYLRNRPPRLARLESADDGSLRVRFQYGFSISGRDRLMSPGEGLALCRNLGLSLQGSEGLFDMFREDLSWLSSTGTFTGDFLYLSPPQYAPGIPVE